MQITRLEIAGFKSFGGRKAFDFKPGITAIVGPNGSGKSNVADAIRWVLGEQKSKRLRVGKSEDVVFHGTEKKPQASMAEVSVVFDNTLGKFPLEVSEIQISRQLLRSGESQYRLNGRRAKLSQIEELLARTGFGTESYTVVGQGTIDQLLTATGSQRKMLFDEANAISIVPQITKSSCYLSNLKSSIYYELKNTIINDDVRGKLYVVTQKIELVENITDHFRNLLDIYSGGYGLWQSKPIEIIIKLENLHFPEQLRKISYLGCKNLNNLVQCTIVIHDNNSENIN